jgi:hypothetical protein
MPLPRYPEFFWGNFQFHTFTPLLLASNIKRSKAVRLKGHSLEDAIVNFATVTRGGLHKSNNDLTEYRSPKNATDFFDILILFTNRGVSGTA